MIKVFLRKIPFYNSNISLKLRDYFFIKKEQLFGYPFLHSLFSKKLEYNLNLKNPSSFNEKLNLKKLKDRNPLLTLTADKYLVREFVSSRVSEDILIPLLFETFNPEEIPFDKLSKNYIIKANHGSGTNIIIRQGEEVDKNEIILKCKDWLEKPYGHRNFEWGYKNIKRRIIIEELLQDEDGKVPVDYKFYLFQGKCKLIHVDFERYGESRSRSLFSTSWEFLDVQYEYPIGHYIKPPKNLERMIEIAEKLAYKLDFVRVDLYDHQGSIYFGEMTHYPGNGMEKFTPQSFDFELGKNWSN